MINIIDKDRDKIRYKLRDLLPGTWITGIKTYPQSVYIKLDKKALGKEFSIFWNIGHCILFNVRIGSLRAIDCEAMADVIKPDTIYIQRVNYSTDEYNFLR